MKIFKKENHKVNVLNKIECDVCKTIYEDKLDMQEIIQIEHSCGFNSIFGDFNTVKLDICQFCFKDKFHSKMTIEELQ